MSVQIDPVLLEVLACPADHHAPLVLGAPGNSSADSLTCTECARVFPIRDGIPVLLLDEALTADGVAAGEGTGQTRVSGGGATAEP